MNVPSLSSPDRRSLLYGLGAVLSATMSQTSVALAEENPGDEGWLSAFGLKMKVEITTKSTGGIMSATRVVSPPGGGPPAHIHTNEDELFVIIRGNYRFWEKGKEAVEAPPGTSIHLHKGVIHQYRNVSDREGEHLLICLPGGLEELFAKVSAEKLSVPRDMDRVVELSSQYGITYKPPIDR